MILHLPPADGEPDSFALSSTIVQSSTFIPGLFRSASSLQPSPSPPSTTRPDLQVRATSSPLSHEDQITCASSVQPLPRAVSLPERQTSPTSPPRPLSQSVISRERYILSASHPQHSSESATSPESRICSTSINRPQHPRPLTSPEYPILSTSCAQSSRPSTSPEYQTPSASVTDGIGGCKELALSECPSQSSIILSTKPSTPLPLSTPLPFFAPPIILPQRDRQDLQTNSKYLEGRGLKNARVYTSSTSHKRKRLEVAQCQPWEQTQEEGNHFVSEESTNQFLPFDQGYKRQRKEEESQDIMLHLKPKDVGHVLASGGLGEVLAYKRGEPERLIVKIYVHATSFNRELRAYQKIRTSDTSIPIPRFHGQAVLPVSSSPRYLQGSRKTFNAHSLGLVLEKLKGPLLSDALHLLDMSQQVALRQAIRAGLDNLHSIGISHQDIKGNNIMFRTKELKDWVFLDFGEVKFCSDLSAKAWRQACASDHADLAAVFDTAEAQYVIDAGIDFFTSYPSPASASTHAEHCVQAESCDHTGSYGHADINCSVLAADCLRHHNNLNVALAPGEVQRHLSSNLDIAVRLPRPAIPLVSSILTTFPSLNPPLAKHIIDILYRSGGTDYALDQLDVQLSSDELPLQYRAQFYRTKISIGTRNCSLTDRIATLKAAVPVLEDYYGERGSEESCCKAGVG